MIVKVCGMRNSENIREVSKLPIDWMGFIFYSGSPRYVGKETIAIDVPAEIKKTGVFVNAAMEEIITIAQDYQLDIIQLHGNESPEFCRKIHDKGYKVIKAFLISHPDDLLRTSAYHGCVDYFLFDTKSDAYGGSGKQFDWSVLECYTGTTPFLLSGGIKLESVPAILSFNHPQLAGWDLNSGFESEPAKKDIEKLNQFINRIKQKI